MMDSEVLYHYPDNHWVVSFQSSDGDAFKQQHTCIIVRDWCVSPHFKYTLCTFCCVSALAEKRIRKKGQRIVQQVKSHLPWSFSQYGVLNILGVKCTLSKKVTEFLPSGQEIAQERRWSKKMDLQKIDSLMQKSRRSQSMGISLNTHLLALCSLTAAQSVCETEVPHQRGHQ